MTQLPPTTARDLDRDHEGDDAELCGAELSGGGICDRPAEECQYHGP